MDPVSGIEDVGHADLHSVGSGRDFRELLHPGVYMHSVSSLAARCFSSGAKGVSKPACKHSHEADTFDNPFFGDDMAGSPQFKTVIDDGFEAKRRNQARKCRRRLRPARLR